MSVHPLRPKPRPPDLALDPNILHVLPANIVVLDAQGTILAVNEAWERFAAANGFVGDSYGLGLNYVHILCGPARRRPTSWPP